MLSKVGGRLLHLWVSLDSSKVEWLTRYLDILQESARNDALGRRGRPNRSSRGFGRLLTTTFCRGGRGGVPHQFLAKSIEAFGGPLELKVRYTQLAILDNRAI